jgi:hypothetical protein
MRRTANALVHVLAVAGLIVLAFLLLLATAEDDTWYHPMEPDGDPSGYAIAAVETTLFIAAPVVVITYSVAVFMCHLLQRRQAVTIQPVVAGTTR